MTTSPRPTEDATVGGGAPLLPGGVMPGATNPTNPDPSANSSGNDGSGDLRASHPLDRARALAELIDPLAFQGEWASEVTKREHQDRALTFAIKVIDAGWVRVSEDEETVDRVARVLHDRLCDRAGGDEACEDYAAHRWYRADARAAVRALREGGAQ